MSSIVLAVTPGAELPDRTLTWNDSNGAVIDFAATPHTFRLDFDFAAPVSKITGITGSSTAPNVTITFTAGETDTWVPGKYRALLWAKRTSDSKDREPLELEVIVRRPVV